MNTFYKILLCGILSVSLFLNVAWAAGPLCYDTVAAAKADIVNIDIGDVLIIKERGSSFWDVIDATTVTENTVNYLEGNSQKTFSLRYDQGEVNSVSELRYLAPVAGYSITTTGVNTMGDGGGHDWHAVTGAAPGTYVDNVGSVVVPTGGDGSAAWLCEDGVPVKCEWFGASQSATGTVNAVAINAATAARCATINAGAYDVKGGLTLVNGLVCKAGKAILYFIDTTGYMVTDESIDNIKGLVLDGTDCNALQGGYRFNVDNSGDETKLIDLAVCNVTNSNTSQPAYGVLVWQDSNGTAVNRSIVIRADVRGVTATSLETPVIGDSAGAAKGILVSINATGKRHSISVVDSYVENVGPVEDGDGVHLVCADNNNVLARGSYKIINTTVVGCAKRQIKIQAAHAIVSNCLLDNYINSSNSGSMAISVYAANVTLDTIKIIDKGTTSAPDLIQCDNTVNLKINNADLVTSNLSKAVRLSNSTNFEINNLKVYSSGTYSTPNFGHIYLENTLSGEINNLQINNTTETVSAIRILASATGNISINGGKITACYYGMSGSYSPLNIDVNGIKITSDKSPIYLTSMSGDYSIKNCKLETDSSSPAIYCLTMTGKLEVQNCKLIGYHGVIAEFDDVDLVNNRIIANSTGNGTGLAVKSNGVIEANKIYAFNIGAQYTYSSNIKTSDNTFVNCTTSEFTTGSTITMTHDNNSY